MNRIQPGSFLTLHYRLAGPDGVDLVNTFGGKPATLTLGTGQLAPALEQLLLGLEDGAQAGFDVAAGDAFGPRNPELVQRVKRMLLLELGDPDARYEVGDVVQFPTPGGGGRYAGVVREVAADWLLFDFNHPLAGQAVRFEVQVLGVLYKEGFDKNVLSQYPDMRDILAGPVVGPPDDRNRDMNSAFEIIYTSGTTGDPKGVVIKANRMPMFKLLAQLGYNPRLAASGGDPHAYLAAGLALFITDRAALNVQDPKLERLLATTLLHAGFCRRAFARVHFSFGA